MVIFSLPDIAMDQESESGGLIALLAADFEALVWRAAETGATAGRTRDGPRRPGCRRGHSAP